jgi:hypothetical protein
MTSPLLVNIKKSQDDYLETILQYKNFLDQDEVSLKQITFMLDQIKCFWLERLQIIEFELEELTETFSCFLLSGAVYLDVSDYEHYYFKSLGDYHLLFDPFLKMEPFFRVPKENINTKETINVLKRVYTDTIAILTKYKNLFFILPLTQIAVSDHRKHHEMLNEVFLTFLSNLLNKEFTSADDFFNNYHSFEEIENDMDISARQHLIFTDSGDFQLCLRDKIDRYCKTQMNFSTLIKNSSEAEIFFISTHSWVSQVIDILIICSYLRVNPYIRFDVTFNYLSLIMYAFIEDKYLKSTLEKTLIFYILYKTILKDRFKRVEFTDFCTRIEDKSLLNTIIHNIRAQEIDLFKGGFKQVQSIILNAFQPILYEP